MSKQFYSIFPMPQNTHKQRRSCLLGSNVAWRKCGLICFLLQQQVCTGKCVFGTNMLSANTFMRMLYDIWPFILSTVSHWGIKSNSGEHKYMRRSFWRFRFERSWNSKDVKFKNAQMWNCSEHLTGLFHGLILFMILSDVSQYSIFIIFYSDVQYDHVFLNKKKKKNLWKWMMISENILVIGWF